jgi:hypothetical protein
LEDTILKAVTRYVVPIMQIFGFYIIFFGMDSPGGGSDCIYAAIAYFDRRSICRDCTCC